MHKQTWFILGAAFLVAFGSVTGCNGVGPLEGPDEEDCCPPQPGDSTQPDPDPDPEPTPEHATDQFIGQRGSSGNFKLATARINDPSSVDVLDELGDAIMAWPDACVGGNVIARAELINATFSMDEAKFIAKTIEIGHGLMLAAGITSESVEARIFHDLELAGARSVVVVSNRDGSGKTILLNGPDGRPAYDGGVRSVCFNPKDTTELRWIAEINGALHLFKADRLDGVVHDVRAMPASQESQTISCLWDGNVATSVTSGGQDTQIVMNTSTGESSVVKEYPQDADPFPWDALPNVFSFTMYNLARQANPANFQNTVGEIQTDGQGFASYLAPPPPGKEGGEYAIYLEAEGDAVAELCPVEEPSNGLIACIDRRDQRRIKRTDYDGEWHMIRPYRD